MTNNKHPHEEVILAYYRGEIIQGLDSSSCKWMDYPRYDPNSIKVSEQPSFSTKFSYRIKPVTVAFTLDIQEIETLWAILQYVGGDPQTTARRHVNSVMEKLEACISDERREQLEEWEGAECSDPRDGIKLTGNLP